MLSGIALIKFSLAGILGPTGMKGLPAQINVWLELTDQLDPLNWPVGWLTPTAEANRIRKLNKRTGIRLPDEPNRYALAGDTGLPVIALSVAASAMATARNPSTADTRGGRFFCTTLTKELSCM